MVKALHGRTAWITLLLALALQLGVHAATPAGQARAQDLGAAPPLASARLMALGEPDALAYGMMLGLQAFDVQPGVSVPWKDLDYVHLRAWLELVLALRPETPYPLLCASRLYAEVPDAARTRSMVAFIAAAFLQDPDRRWPWMAHAVVLARHRLEDPALALRLAQTLRTQIHDPAIPHWVGQMDILALADLGQDEAARVLLGGLLDSGSITDANEKHFLLERLEALRPVAKDASSRAR